MYSSVVKGRMIYRELGTTLLHFPPELMKTQAGDHTLIPKHNLGMQKEVARVKR
jgi:hypothetical protein